jgi:ribosomal protein S3
MKPTESEMKIYKAIGEFYLKKHANDYEKTREDLRNLLISDVICAYDVVIIKTSRPGLLIGKKGENITALEKHLEKRVAVVEVNSFSDWLMPYPETDYGGLPEER